MLLNARDTISGNEGKAFATINGQVHELFYVIDIEATIEKQKAEVKVLGSRGTHYKTTGWSGSGSATFQYITSRFRNLMMDYIKTGRDTYFDLQVVNQDPSSATGKQTVVLKNCNIDSNIMAKLDVGSEDPLDEEFDFTFEDVEVLDSFNELTV